MYAWQPLQGLGRGSEPSTACLLCPQCGCYCNNCCKGKDCKPLAVCDDSRGFECKAYDKERCGLLYSTSRQAQWCEIKNPSTWPPFMTVRRYPDVLLRGCTACLRCFLATACCHGHAWSGRAALTNHATRQGPTQTQLPREHVWHGLWAYMLCGSLVSAWQCECRLLLHRAGMCG